MITAELTTRKIKSLKVEILRKNDYLDTPRYDVRALDGEPFTDRNSEGHFIPTAYATVLRSQIDNIQKIGVVNQHPAEIAAALDTAKASLTKGRMERFDEIRGSEVRVLNSMNKALPQSRRIAAGVLAGQIVNHL